MPGSGLANLSELDPSSGKDLGGGGAPDGALVRQRAGADPAADRQLRQADVRHLRPRATPNRLFVVEREGTIVQVEDGHRHRLRRPPLAVGSTAVRGERGLQSIALSPDFATSGRFYVDYSERTTPASIHVAEMRATGGPAPLSTPAQPADDPPPRARPTTTAASSSSGRKATSSSPPATAAAATTRTTTPRTSNSLLGKILRIDPDPTAPAPTRSRPATRSPAAGARDRSGATACATPTASPSTARAATS